MKFRVPPKEFSIFCVFIILLFYLSTLITGNVGYQYDINTSKYNRTSAVNTINSLPDLSNGSNNVIQFNANSGLSTEGGAISTMTEEEVAVAVAKGWTVSYV